MNKEKAWKVSAPSLDQTYEKLTRTHKGLDFENLVLSFQLNKKVEHVFTIQTSTVILDQIFRVNSCNASIKLF